MDIEQIREYTLSIPGVTEDQPFGDDLITFRIEGKIFMCLSLGSEDLDPRDMQPRFAIKLSPDRNEELREHSAAIVPAWHWNKKHWSDVFYTVLDDNFVKALITESYSLVVSKLPKTKREKYQ
ncbi:MAG: MmcQ/YjbR family DNA-binding protein [Prevotellaceae bacterium]|nr:MmcQ/YjbR family DNA-binding protein [Candidatus Colivivens caballi]